MPVYEYKCPVHGVFTALRKISESSAPAFCECCGTQSHRIMSAPRLAVLAKSQRMAHERNEKSAHDPKVAKRTSCGCTGSHTCKTSTKVNSETGQAALQRQTKKTARPWMLAH
jgi:putative FmdB family regulatory protein